MIFMFLFSCVRNSRAMSASHYLSHDPLLHGKVACEPHSLLRVLLGGRRRVGRKRSNPCAQRRLSDSQALCSASTRMADCMGECPCERLPHPQGRGSQSLQNSLSLRSPWPFCLAELEAAQHDSCPHGGLTDAPHRASAPLLLRYRYYKCFLP